MTPRACPQLIGGQALLIIIYIMIMTIRLEQPQDYREVERLTRDSFWNVYRPGCTEHYVLPHYRNNPDFIPELDFVMEQDGMIIGPATAPPSAFLTPRNLLGKTSQRGASATHARGMEGTHAWGM